MRAPKSPTSTTTSLYHPVLGEDGEGGAEPVAVNGAEGTEAEDEGELKDFKRPSSCHSLLIAIGVVTSTALIGLLIVILSLSFLFLPPPSPPCPPLPLLPLPLPLSQSALLHPQRATSSASDDWRVRLQPVRVEALEGHASVVVNLMQLTGFAHWPPLFSSLPCLSPSVDSTTFHAADSPCTEERLETAAGADAHWLVEVAVYRQADIDAAPPLPLDVGRAVHRGLHRAAVDPRMLEGEEAQRTVNEFVQRCAVVNASTTWNCSEAEVGDTVHGLVMPYVALFNVLDLQMNESYRVAVRVSNGSFATSPVLSAPFHVASQMELFTLERRRQSGYFDAMFPSAMNSSTSPNTQITATRLAPFEAANGRDDEGGLCPRAFTDFAAAYAQWHAAEVAKLRMILHDPTRLMERFSPTSTDPLKVFIFGFNEALLTAGLADRSTGLLGFYTLSMLSQRLLLLDEGWPELNVLVQFSIPLTDPTLTRTLRQPAFANVTATMDFVNQLIPISDINRVFPSPITWVTSNRGLQFRLLFDSPDLSPVLKAMGLTSINLVGCVYHSFLVLRTSVLYSHAQYRQIMRELLDLHMGGLGIQVRTMMVEQEQYINGQQLADPSVDDIIDRAHTGFFHCAHDMTDEWFFPMSPLAPLPPITRVVWFLLADSQRLRTAAWDRWGPHRVTEWSSFHLRTLMIPALLGHAAKARRPGLQLLLFQHSLMEQFLYSACQRHIISHLSGFVRMAMMLSMQATYAFVFTTDDESRMRQQCLDNRTAYSLDWVARTHSGV